MQVWMNVRESYSRALEQGTLHETLTLVAEGALPTGPEFAGVVGVRLFVAVALEGVLAASVLAAGQAHAVVAQVTLPEKMHASHLNLINLMHRFHLNMFEPQKCIFINKHYYRVVYLIMDNLFLTLE